MKARGAKAGWGTCFGVLGLLTIGGVVTTFAGRPAEAQTPQRTPQQIFDRACGRCHSEDDEDAGPNLHNKNKTVEQVTTIVRQGSKRMRAIPPTKLSDPDLTRMMEYLRSIHAVR